MGFYLKLCHRDIKALLFEREMELISLVFALPQLPTEEDPSDRVLDFRSKGGVSEAILLGNGKFMALKHISRFYILECKISITGTTCRSY